MTSSHPRHNSFVLRLWWEQTDTAGSHPLWRGWVQHVPSFEAVYVQDVAGLLAFLERWLGRLTDPDQPTTRLR